MPYQNPNGLENNGFVITQTPELYDAATNYLLHSAQFDDAVWVKVGTVTVTANTAEAPNGVTEADTVNDPTGSVGDAYISQTVTIPADTLPYCASCWMTAGTSIATLFHFRFDPAVPPLSDGVFIIINLQTGAFQIQTTGFPAGIPAPLAGVDSITLNGVKWYRPWISFHNSNLASCLVLIDPAKILTSMPIAGSCKVWGAQVEQGTSPTGNIPTVAATVSRVAGKLPPWILDVSGGGGSGTVTSVAETLAKDATETIAGSPVTTAGTLARTAVDAGADKLIFWDDSASQKDYAALSGSLVITGTTIDIVINQNITPTLNMDGFGVIFNNAPGVTATDPGMLFDPGASVLILGTESNAAGVDLHGNTALYVPTIDGGACGVINNNFQSGYSSSAVGDLVYLDSSGKWQKTDANTLALYNGFLAIALEIKANGAALKVALPGSFVYSTAFPTLTIGAPVYMSETAGQITQTAPTTTDSATRVIGWAVHADKIWFQPSPDYITHT